VSQRIVVEQIDIARPPADVFAFLTDSANWSKVDDTVVRLEPIAHVSLGTNGIVTNRRAGGLKATTKWEITEFVPGSRFTNRIVGVGYELSEAVDLSSTPTGTKVSASDSLRSTSPVGWLMVPLSGGIIRQDLQKRMATLKSLLEAADPA
jgi:hypothetical protein